MRWAKSKGWNVTAEVCPHHLLLTDDLAATYDPIYKVNPPLRSSADVEALREGLADGTIDVVATDHAPHPHEDKDCEWAAAAFGMLGLETALSIVQETMVDAGLLDWAGVADRMSARAGPDRPGRRPRPAARGRPAGQRGALRPGRAPGGRRHRVGQPEPQHAVRRHGAARPGRRDVPARPGHGAGRQAAVSELAAPLREAAAASGFSGVVRVDRPGEEPVVLTRGLADRAHGVPFTQDTRVGVASGAKGFTALTVMRLVEDGVSRSTPGRASCSRDDLPLIDDG